MGQITTSEAARRLGITRFRVCQMIAEGKLPAVKFGRDWVILEDDLRPLEHRPGPGRPAKRPTAHA